MAHRKCVRLSSFFLAVAIVHFLLAGCGPSKQDAKKAAAERAVKSLRKVQAATQVGVTLVVYRQVLIEAQAEINEANRTFSTETKFGRRLREAMIAFADAATFWDLKNSGRTFYRDDVDGKKLIEQYAALPYGVYGKDAGKMSGPEFVLKADPQVGIQRAWLYADIHTRVASDLIEEGDFDSLW